MINVIKRDSRIVRFDKQRIVNALKKANNDVAQQQKIDDKDIDEIVSYIETIASSSKEDITVEKIQDIVESELVKRNMYALAKSYIIYRYNRMLLRKSNTTDETILQLIKDENKELREENSNKNTRLASTQRDYIAGEVSRDLTRRVLLPEKISKAHDDGILHFHDTDYFVQPIFNCCLINISDMLDNGTVMNGKMIESPKSFQVACTVVTQIIAAIASNQYGGQSVDMIHLGKYLRKSKQKYYNEYREKLGKDMDWELLEKIVEIRLRDELKSGVQTIQYQINTLMTTNGQAPFVTLFLHLDENDPYIEENAMIIEEILSQRYEGIKNDQGIYITPEFPKLVYVLDEINCLKGGKYDYLTKLAAKCTSKRMYPDYISAKQMRENYEGNVFSPMGCVDGESIINYKIRDTQYTESFEEAWDRLSKIYETKTQPNGKDMYMDCDDVYIWDNCLNAYTKQLRIIRNVQSSWRHLEFSNGLRIDATIDHPFEVMEKGVVPCELISLNDVMMCESSSEKSEFDFCHVTKINGYTKTKYSYDVTTESEHFMVNGIYSHNCRSFLSPWKDENGKYKFEGRFNQGVVSINLPQIGIIADGDEEVFWKLLDERLQICYEALMCRHKSLLGTLSDISPIHWQYGGIARLNKGEKIDKLLFGGYSTLSLGYIGLYETTKLMKGVSHTTKVGEEFAIRLMKYLKKTVLEWREKTNIGFALYGTPAESLCYRFARIDKEKFGDIPDVTDKGYYTNSYHVDVRENIDAFTKFKFESQFQPISSGGAISYVEIPNMQNNVEAIETCIKFIYDNIQYGEFNTKSDYCHVCGFDGEIIVNDSNEWECPQCHNKDHKKMNVCRRTCGYLGSNFWNEGKTKEIKQRVLHL